MKNKTYSITKAGYKHLTSQKEKLEKKLKQIKKHIQENYLSESTFEDVEYYQMQSDVIYLKDEINKITKIIRNSSIKKNQPNGKVQIGSEVTLKSSNKKLTFFIVDPVEANPQQGRISTESPLGKAIINRKKGETIQMKSPNGKSSYKIESIK
jgi:transcription elongation factor GreA